MRKLRFITRRRLKWVAVIAAGLIAALFISTLWISPQFITLKRNHQFWLSADRGRVDMNIISGGPYPHRILYTLTSIKKDSSIGFDLWFFFDRGPLVYTGGPPTPGKASASSGNASGPPRITPLKHTEMAVPLWFPFVLCALPAVYLWRTDRAEPWQCAACRYDLRGIDSDLCPECGKLAAGAG